MKNFLRTILFIIMPVLLLLAIVKAQGFLFTGGGYGPNLNFTKLPSISGPDDITLTKYTDLDGVTWWDNRKIYISIRTEVEGFGDLSLALEDITVGGSDKRDPDEYSISRRGGDEIGRWGEFVGLLPVSAEATFASIGHSFEYDSPEAEGVYGWSASGTASLTPYKWEWDFGFNSITGEWIPQKPKEESAKKVSGSWTVKHKYVCPICKVEHDKLEDFGDEHDYVENEPYRKCDPKNKPNPDEESDDESETNEGVFVNQTGFKAYETLTVKVVKDKLYMVNMYIDGEYVTYGYAEDGKTATVYKTFSSGDTGSKKVEIYIYTNLSEESKHEFYISVD